MIKDYQDHHEKSSNWIIINIKYTFYLMNLILIKMNKLSHWYNKKILTIHKLNTCNKKWLINRLRMRLWVKKYIIFINYWIKEI